ncbi:MAG TPA: tRNA dihydrouridine synthase DusB [Gammaproteobacteria bacterium]|nr:tRNA dihydrouridine synthase DusB [Gammaproteobacteria bacterium]
MQIGHYTLRNNLALAPMAGVTDRPFRQLCKRLGAGMAASEMVSCNAQLWGSDKTRRRIDHDGEPEPRIVQIAGADPGLMARAARYNVDRGAQIIDINMGCPAKKVCSVMAGSALLRDEVLVAHILEAVVNAVDVPVTLKIRTGWNTDQRNGMTVARIAESAGIQALAVHGRTRACGYTGEAEHDTTAAIKATVNIPVIANGDIRTPRQAKAVLDYTGADGLMIGRGAQGRPWIFGMIEQYLTTGTLLPEPTYSTIRDLMLEHLNDLYEFYGEHKGVLIARKHISWYSKSRPGDAEYRRRVNQAPSAKLQLQMTRDYFDHLAVNNLGIAA